MTRPLRVSVLSPPELFANRTTDLLRSMGVDARRPRPSGYTLRGVRARLDRTRRGLATDVFLHMCGRRDLGRLQTWLARLGIPTLMVWIGSDAPRYAANASTTVVARVWHWCVAPWLQEEVAEAGIAAEVVPLTPPSIPSPSPALPPDFSVLAYTLDGRSDLYGLDLVLELARRQPDIPFVLLGAAPSEAFPENIRALRWVDDMHATVTGSTVYVRPTSHDGMSNLVLEALAYGRYAMWTYPFPGVDQISTIDSAESRLSELHRLHAEGRLSLNHEGREAVFEMFDPDVVRKDILERLRLVTERRWRRPPGKLQRWASDAALKGLRVLFRADRAWNS